MHNPDPLESHCFDSAEAENSSNFQQVPKVGAVGWEMHNKEAAELKSEGR